MRRNCALNFSAAGAALLLASAALLASPAAASPVAVAPSSDPPLLPRGQAEVGEACAGSSSSCKSLCCFSGTCAPFDRCFPFGSFGLDGAACNSSSIDQCLSGCCADGVCSPRSACGNAAIPNVTPRPGLMGDACASSEGDECQTQCCLRGQCAPAVECYGGEAYPVHPGLYGDACLASNASQCATGCCLDGVCVDYAECFGGGESGGDADLGKPEDLVAAGIGAGMLVYQCRSPGMVALTFDDGSFKDTEALLNILDGRNVKATFFVNGQNFDDVRNRAGLIRRMKNTGHCAGLHGYFHYDMRTLDRDKQYANLKQLDDLLLQIMGARTRFFRPPYGGIGADTAAVCASLGLDIIMWNVDSRDWEYHDNKRSVAVYEAQCTDPRTQSFVGLQHDVFPETALGLASWVIDTLRYRGFRFVTVGECVYGSTSACYQ